MKEKIGGVGKKKTKNPTGLIWVKVEVTTRSYSVMVSTSDSESGDPSSNLGRTFQSRFHLLYDGMNDCFIFLNTQ